MVLRLERGKPRFLGEIFSRRFFGDDSLHSLGSVQRNRAEATLHELLSASGEQ